MSKVWVKTDYVPEESKEIITEGKWYEVEKKNACGGSTLDDQACAIFILFQGCAFLEGGSWTVYEGETPPVLQQPEEIKEESNMIGEISRVDWSKAPEDATHVNNTNNRFYKIEGNKVFVYYSHWVGSCFESKDFLNGDEDFVPKKDDLLIVPKITLRKVPQTEWKIRHIKSDDYKSGRDVAITILYKEIGEGYYEYKFAICSPNDMFSRKKGVEEALKKESDKLYSEGSVAFTGLVLMHMSISNKFSKDTRSLILSKMAELV